MKICGVQVFVLISFLYVHIYTHIYSQKVDQFIKKNTLLLLDAQKMGEFNVHIYEYVEIGDKPNKLSFFIF